MHHCLSCSADVPGVQNNDNKNKNLPNVATPPTIETIVINLCKALGRAIPIKVSDSILQNLHNWIIVQNQMKI